MEKVQKENKIEVVNYISPYHRATAVSPACRTGKACRATHGSSTTWFQTSRCCHAKVE